MSNSDQPKQIVEPIKWSNLGSWARKTAIADRKKYRRKERSLSIHRVWRMLIPNLRRPVFIVGSGRSGTTFLGSCLSELPEFSYHFEPIVTKAATKNIYEGSWQTAYAKWFYRRVYAWLMRLHGDADLRFAVKQPRNSLIIPFLHNTFPDAQFIHIIRDGRDVALSWSKKPWLKASQKNIRAYEPGGYQYGPYARLWVEDERINEFEKTSDIHRCIWGWRQLTEHVLNASISLPKDQYHELRYEELIANLIDEAEHILDFLKIKNSTSQTIFKNVVSQVKPDSIGRWQHELSSDQLREVEIEAGELLHRLGYSNDRY